VVSESRVTCATSVPILIFLGLSVLDLGPMYATDRRQTERQTLTVAPIEGHHFDQQLLVCVYRQQNDFSTNVDHVGDDRLGDMSVMRYGYNLQLRFGLSSTRFFKQAVRVATQYAPARCTPDAAAQLQPIPYACGAQRALLPIAVGAMNINELININDIRESATIFPGPCKLTFDLLTL